MANSSKSPQTRLTHKADSSRNNATPESPEVERESGFNPNFSPGAGALQRAIANPRRASHSDILALQRTYGNQAVQRLLKDSPKPALPTQPSQIQRKNFKQTTSDADIAYSGLKSEKEFHKLTKLVKPKTMYKSKSKSTGNVEAQLEADRLVTVVGRPDKGIFRTWVKIIAAGKEGYLITDGEDRTFKKASEVIGHKAGGVIMESTPTVADIRQGMMGDCFLLASLMSLVRQNPSYVQTPGKLFQTDPSTVQEKHKVRFYQIHQPTTGEGPTFTPDTVEVSNSILQTKENLVKTDGSTIKAGNLGSQGTQPWPAIIEKAFQLWDNKHAMDSLSGGQSHRASMYLTGEAYKQSNPDLLDSETRGKTPTQVTQMKADKKASLITAASSGAVITVSTPDSPPEQWKSNNPGQAGGKGGSNEPIWGGILFKHVYELVSANDQQVVLRNPWGWYSRVNGVINEAAAESVLTWPEFMIIASNVSVRDTRAPLAPTPAPTGTPAPVTSGSAPSSTTTP